VIPFDAVHLFVSSPPFFPVDPETADDVLVIDYFIVGDSFSFGEQPGKQKPLDAVRYRLFHSLLCLH
jgi:hypothetical protein